jgi:hypothetical protein
MVQSSTNESMIIGNNETVEICINDVVLEDMSKENPNVQKKKSNNLENGSDKIMKVNLKKLHV